MNWKEIYPEDEYFIVYNEDKSFKTAIPLSELKDWLEKEKQERYLKKIAKLIWSRSHEKNTT